MKKTRFILSMAIVASLVFTQCRKAETEVDNSPKGLMEQIEVPDNFDFNTTKTITLNPSNTKKGTEKTRYTVYAWNPDFEKSYTVTNPETGIQENVIDKNYDNYKLGTYNLSDSESSDIEIPSYINNLVIIENGSKLHVQPLPSAKKSTVIVNSALGELGQDYIIAVKYASAESYRYLINPLTSETILLDYVIPHNTDLNIVANAFDSKRKTEYYFSNATPTTLSKKPYLKDEISIVKTGIDVGSNGKYCLGFDNVNDVLYSHSYSSTAGSLYKLDTLGNVLNSWNVTPPDGSLFTGYDIAIDSDGQKAYIALNIGLGVIDLTNLTADNIVDKVPNFTDNSSGNFAFSDGKIYVSGYLGNLAAIDVTTGGSEILTSTDIWYNDFAVIDDKYYGQINPDTDGDGIADSEDEFPDDAERAFTRYYPSETEWRTLGFEDLWPSKGDYDFNDLVIAYKARHIFNADNLEVEQFRTIKLLNDEGTSFKNGLFMYEYAKNIPLSDLNKITSTYQLTENYITMDAAKGIEAGHDFIVTPVFDNSLKLREGDEVTLKVEWNTPRTAASFYFFMVANSEKNGRGREIHAPSTGGPTSLADMSQFGTLDDDSNLDEERYYRSVFDLPWNLSMFEDYKIPNEKTTILEAYPNFKNWVESGGASDADWYLYPAAGKVQE